MPFQTQDEWRVLFESTKLHHRQIKKRLDALDVNRILVTPGQDFDDADAEVVTRAMTQPEITAMKQKIRAEVQAIIAEHQASIS